MVERVRVVLTAAVTWLIAFGAVVAVVADELAPFRTVPYVGAALNVLAAVAVVVAVIVRVIQRSTPVLPAARGVLPPPPGVPVTAREVELRTRHQPASP
jgi:hypothetical protein